MKVVVHQLIESMAEQRRDATALVHKDRAMSYGELWQEVARAACGFARLGLARQERVAVYLDKRIETVAALFGAAAAGGVFVPVNPLLRGHQVAYILRDCNVRVLVTSPERLDAVATELKDCSDLRWIVLVGGETTTGLADVEVLSWEALGSGSDTTPSAPATPVDLIDRDMAAILYTSGSTGQPKGVVLSHQNLLVGAASVSQYLENDAEDRILAVLPLSFDAGLSQLTTGFCVGATVVLMNYLLPRDVVRTCEKERITGITGVPPLWFKLANEEWPTQTGARLRYFANTGGHMPRPTLDRLRSVFPNARPYLMYGLTEAFRSTYLDPAEVDRRPDSMGKAIPNAQILVVDENGRECGAGEPGELVHRGALVSLGYWNAPELTAQRFRPAPGQPAGIPVPEIAVWSGDLVRKDDDGFLYFIGRNDEMIKTSGYRVSPTEVEEVIFRSGLVSEVAAVGVPHEELGQAIVVFAVAPAGQDLDVERIRETCRRQLPLYMVPSDVQARDSLPRNQNGKIDRQLIREELAQKTGGGAV
ncbi:MAG: acyl-CoA ligase (AMP-forming), exosortase A system-associated [Planctomycetota bacterium]